MNFDGLESLSNIDQKLSISNNPLLQNFNSIANIPSFINFYLENNNNLIQLPNFKNVTSLEDIYIGPGGALNDLQGLNNLEFAKSITFKQSNIKSLEGLEKLKKITLLLKIERCHNLTNLNGLDNLSVVGIGNSNHGINISFNKNIKNLSGINKLIKIDGKLYIYDNKSLNSLDGLESIIEIDEAIQIFWNENLSDFCSLTYFFNNYDFNGGYDVLKNLRNPTIQEIKNGNCD